MGIPVAITLASKWLPDSLISKFAPSPLRVSPCYALLGGVALVYTPFGISLFYKMYLTKGDVDNQNPRQQAEKLAASNPVLARLLAAEKNMQEGWMIFAPAVLAAMH